MGSLDGAVFGAISAVVPAARTTHSATSKAIGTPPRLVRAEVDL
jgi:hypothetical protein